MTPFSFPIRRTGRGSMLLWLVIGSAGFSLLQWLVFRRLDLMINLGFRTDAIASPGRFPAWYVALELLFDLALVIVAIGRLHDIGRSGWWLAGLALAAILGSLSGALIIVFLSIAAWLALLFWPGSLGPNAFGPDRYGWRSREDYRAQMRQLREGSGTGR